MKDNQKFTIGLIAIAIGLGAYMYFVESKKEIKPDSKDVEVWSLSEGQASDLKRLLITADGKTATYTRDGDTWKLAEEPKREVDQVNFKSPYDKLRDLMAGRKVEEKRKDDAKYGLDKPAATITWGDDKTPYKLTVGATSPIGDAYFVHVAKDDGIYTIAKYKVDEWKNLAAKPPLLPEPTPSPKPSAAPSVSAAPSTAPSAAASTAPSAAASAATSAAPSAAASAPASAAPSAAASAAH